MVAFLTVSNAPSKDVSLPVELIEIIVECAVNPTFGMSADDHLERQKTGLALTLTCKAFQGLVEPLLYKWVTLVHDGHLKRFENTVSSDRGAALASTHTKAMWVLCNSCAHRPEVIFETCRNLEHLVLRMNATQMLQFMPRNIAPFPLQELTLIDPFGRPHLQFLKLERLHIISSVVNVHATLQKFPGAIISRIPKLCIETTSGEWNGQLYFSLGLFNLFETLGEQRERGLNRIWLKVHDAVKRDWQPSDILSEEWWTSEISLPVAQDVLDHMKVMIVDKDGLDPVGLEKALRAIDYNAMHWAEPE